MALEGFGNPLLRTKRGRSLLLRRTLNPMRGMHRNQMDAATLVRVLCDLDDMYHRCYYHVSTMSSGKSGSTASSGNSHRHHHADDDSGAMSFPDPVRYLSSTAPDTSVALEQFRANEVDDKMWNAFCQIFDLDRNWDVSGANPLLSATVLRFKETVLLFYSSGLGKDGRMDIAAEKCEGGGLRRSQTGFKGSASGSSSGGAGVNKSAKKLSKKQKREFATRTASASACKLPAVLLVGPERSIPDSNKRWA